MDADGWPLAKIGELDSLLPRYCASTSVGGKNDRFCYLTRGQNSSWPCIATAICVDERRTLFVSSRQRTASWPSRKCKRAVRNSLVLFGTWHAARSRSAGRALSLAPTWSNAACRLRSWGLRKGRPMPLGDAAKERPHRLLSVDGMPVLLACSDDFPVNRVEDIPAPYIDLTRALMFETCVWAAKHTGAKPDLHAVPEHVQKRVLKIVQDNLGSWGQSLENPDLSPFPMAPLRIDPTHSSPPRNPTTPETRHMAALSSIYTCKLGDISF